MARDVVLLEAAADDSDGTVTRVEFYDGTTLIGTATSAPYRVNWTAAYGNRSLTARAFDDRGAQSTSAVVSVRTEAPTSLIDCAGEGGTCAIPSSLIADVYYGAAGTFSVRQSVSGSISCSNAVFGDPIRGVVKRCFYAVVP